MGSGRRRRTSGANGWPLSKASGHAVRAWCRQHGCAEHRFYWWRAIGAVHLLARRVGLIETVDQDVQLLKVHLPYYESDDVTSIAYNILVAQQFQTLQIVLPNRVGKAAGTQGG